MMDPDAFARDWVATWNARDVERVLAHYRDDARFVSPTATRVTGSPIVEGKAALRAYWTKALTLIGALTFSLDHAVWDERRRELVIVYNRDIAGKRDRACEIFRFDEDGLVSGGEALYGVELPG